MEEPNLVEMIDAPQVERARKAIAEKALLYGGPYLLAVASCLVLIFYSGWFRWIAGFLVSACLVSAWSMRGVLSSLGRAREVLAERDNVLNNHVRMNAIAILLLAYALSAIWTGWPLPSLAAFIAGFINFVHYAGYQRFAITERGSM